MASVQQLEKLIHIQKMFAVEDSLEAAVMMERLETLITRTEQILRQRTFFREERRLLRLSTAKVEKYIAALAIVRKSAWVSPTMIDNNSPDAKRVLINIGGLMFETTAHVLMKEEKSLLAQLCGPHPPAEPDHEGIFYFERDWWLFRYILMFLRDGQLPSDHRLLAQLYREASFWRLPSLQLAIEEEKLNLRRERPSQEAADAAKKWWTTAPSWWNLEAPAPQPAPPPEDWWAGTVYKGRSFKPEDMPTSHDVHYSDSHYLPTGYKDPLHPIFGEDVAARHEKEFSRAKEGYPKKFLTSHTARDLTASREGDNLFPPEEATETKRSIRFHPGPGHEPSASFVLSRAYEEELMRRSQGIPLFGGVRETRPPPHNPLTSLRHSLSRFDRADISELELSSDAARELGYRPAELRGLRGSRVQSTERPDADFADFMHDLGHHRSVMETRMGAEELLGLRKATAQREDKGDGGQQGGMKRGGVVGESPTLRIRAATESKSGKTTA